MSGRRNETRVRDCGCTKFRTDLQLKLLKDEEPAAANVMFENLRPFSEKLTLQQQMSLSRNILILESNGGFVFKTLSCR